MPCIGNKRRLSLDASTRVNPACKLSLWLLFIFQVVVVLTNDFQSILHSQVSGYSKSAAVAATPTNGIDHVDTEKTGPSSDSMSANLNRQAEEKKFNLNQILVRAGKSGLGGGIPGALAGVVQVLSLMWLRTIINHQSRYGTSFTQSLVTLLRDGGIPRLYRGLGFALIQAPLARFVSTAANDGVISLMASLPWTKDWGAGRTTFVASLVVGIWRMLMMPIDTMKTVLQVDSFEGFRNLMRRVKAGRIGVLYSGAIANAISSIMGHYPWFTTYNFLSRSSWLNRVLPARLYRNALIGLLASIVSDTVVNGMRVIKTTKQAVGSKHSITYLETVKLILAADGWKGLFGRGLKTRILANALQSIVFTVIWRGLAERLKRPKVVESLEKRD